MTSPWGQIPVFDAHVHFLSHFFFCALAAQKTDWPAEGRLQALAAALEWQLPAVEPERLAESWVSELDRYGVARAALIASVPGDEASVAAAVSRFPDRFYGYFMVDPTAPDAFDRAGKALSSGRLQGICLFPAMHRYSVRDDRVNAILDLASRHAGTIAFIHCGVLTVGVRKKLGLPSPFDMRFSNPIDLHAVALRFPTVNFVIPHFGAGYLREALMVCDLCPNIYLDTSSTNSWIRYEPEAVDLTAVFRRALEVAGPGRLLFGSDSSFFPRGWHAGIFNTQARVLRELGLEESEARMIFSENLGRLLSRSQPSS